MSHDEVVTAQMRLKELGYYTGPIDGLRGPIMNASLVAFALDALREEDNLRAPVIAEAWMPPAVLERVIVHWTAGRWRPSQSDLDHYHFLIDEGGAVHRGVPVERNSHPLKAGYAAHTMNCNTGSIGVAVCAMLGAKESPFEPGSYPIVPAQWSKLALVVADLCERYDIPVNPRTVLSHAEVQGTLGIKQKGKIDIIRLPFDPSLVGATAVGDNLRAAVLAVL